MDDTTKPHRKTYDWLKQYQFQKGNNANPNGRPKGKSLKTFAREMFESMNEDDKAEFLKELDPRIIWEMAEGKPKADIELSGEVTSKIISIDE